MTASVIPTSATIRKPVERLFIARTTSPGGGVYWLSETDGWVIFRHLASALPSHQIAAIVNGTVRYDLETVS